MAMNGYCGGSWVLVYVKETDGMFLSNLMLRVHRELAAKTMLTFQRHVDGKEKESVETVCLVEWFLWLSFVLA